MLTSAHQTPMFEHAGVALCRFRCPAGHGRWGRENHITDGHNLVFPELPIEIRPADRPPILCDSNLAVFYNHGDPYRRGLRHPKGDSSNVFIFDAEHLIPALAPYRPDAEPDRPLSIRHTRVGARTYLKQRLLLARVSLRPLPDPDRVVEHAVEILEEVLAAGYERPIGPPQDRSPAWRRQRDRVDEVKRLLQRRFTESISLRDLAAAVETSVYHLCRVFKRHTGQTINGYVQRLRQREGLAALERTDIPLARLALDLGYAHQSHFTEAFRRQYGTTPGSARRRLRDGTGDQRTSSCRRWPVNP